MKRKILFAFILLIIFIGTVSADQLTTVGKYKFNIPDGFDQIHEFDVNNEKKSLSFVDCHVNSKTFKNYFQGITITVTSRDEGKFPNELKSYYGGGNDAKIKGMDGHLSLDGHDYVYSYVRDGDWIVIKAWDLYKFEDIIVV